MGEVEFGRYRLIELLGRGGMGEVWRAHDTAIDRTVAIKMLLPYFAQDEKFEQRFRREARAAARLENPHVVPIYDVGEIDGRLYVAMRLINGQDLQTLLDAGALEPQRAVAIIEQVAKALHAAHEVDLIHRDIKPSNILLDRDDFAYLIDFGIARAAGETGLTSTGATIGTWSYMAPELFSTGQAEARSDIYALACVLYQGLTGELPFPAVALQQIAVAHMTTPPPQPSTERPTIPTAMDTVIATGLAKDPTHRYATTIELADAARHALTSGQYHTPPTAPALLADPTRPAPAFSPDSQQPADATLAANQQGRPPLAPRPRPARPSPQHPAPPITRNRQPLKLVAVAAAALLVVLVVLGVTHSKHSNAPAATTSTSIPTSATPTATTPTGPPPVAEGRLDDLLLNSDQIDNAMGASGMRLIGPKYPTSGYDDADKVPDKDCLPMASPGETPVYAGSGSTAMRTQEFAEQVGPDATHDVLQVVVLFPSAREAETFFTASAQRWPACSNRPFNEAFAGKPDQVPSVGAVSNSNGTLSARKTIPQGYYNWRTCQRALTVANNVAIDIEACSYNRSDSQSDAGVNIAQQIAAKVPKT